MNHKIINRPGDPEDILWSTCPNCDNATIGYKRFLHFLFAYNYKSQCQRCGTKYLTSYRSGH